MIRYMLDTDICIYTIKNRPLELRDRFNQEAAHICMSAVTLAELMFGAEKSSQTERNLSVVENFSARMPVLPFGEKASAHFGEIRAVLERKGESIGPYDLMIAGHARSEGLVVVSNNIKEFSRVEGLRIENWVTH